MTTAADPSESAADVPRFRYSAALADQIETSWQDRWDADGTFHTPNPVGPLSDGFDRVAILGGTAQRLMGIKP